MRERERLSSFVLKKPQTRASVQALRTLDDAIVAAFDDEPDQLWTPDDFCGDEASVGAAIAARGEPSREEEVVCFFWKTNLNLSKQAPSREREREREREGEGPLSAFPAHAGWPSAESVAGRFAFALLDSALDSALTRAYVGLDGRRAMFAMGSELALATASVADSVQRQYIRIGLSFPHKSLKIRQPCPSVVAKSDLEIVQRQRHCGHKDHSVEHNFKSENLNW